jgi:hypothetical protein
MDILVAGLCFWFCATIIVSRLQNRKQIANFAVSLATLGLTVFSREAWSRCFSRGLVSPLFLLAFLFYCRLTIGLHLLLYIYCDLYGILIGCFVCDKDIFEVSYYITLIGCFWSTFFSPWGAVVIFLDMMIMQLSCVLGLRQKYASLFRTMPSLGPSCFHLLRYGETNIDVCLSTLPLRHRCGRYSPRNCETVLLDLRQDCQWTFVFAPYICGSWGILATEGGESS